MKLIFAFSAIVAAVSGVRQPAVTGPSESGDGLVTVIDYEPSAFLDNPATHAFETIPDTDSVCKPTLYVAKSLPDTHLFKVNEAVTGLEDLTVGCAETTVGYNAMGYNFRDNFIYAVTDHEHSDDLHHIVRIDRHGCSENVAELGSLGEAEPGHSGIRHIAGDVHDGTTLWVGQKDKFRAVSLTPLAGSDKLTYYSWTFPVCTGMNDFAFSSNAEAAPGAEENFLNGDAFGWDLQENKFCRFSPSANGGQNPMPELLSDFGVNFPENAIIGGLFFDHEGSVWMYDNKNDNLYKFTGLNAAVGAWNNNQVAPALTQEFMRTVAGGVVNNNNIDGCSCVDSPGIITTTDNDPRCRLRAEL